jgi:flagellar protein FliS
VNISKAIEAIENKDISTAHNSIVKTEDIFYYLIDSLDMRYPISKNLLALYDFINDRLVQANIKKDLTPLREAQKIASELRDTWKKAEVLTRTGG